MTLFAAMRVQHRPVLKLVAVAVLGALHMSAFAQTTAPAETAAAIEIDATAIERQRPQGKPLKYELPPIDPKQVSPPTPLMPRESISVPDRWRIMDTLGFKFPWYDPYNHNVYKGDKPYEPFAKWGPDWFLALSVISDSLIEARRLPTPVGAQSSDRPVANDMFGRSRQTVFVETLIFSAAALKGNTTFKPPDYEFRFVPAIQINHAIIGEVRGLRVDPREGKTRTDSHLGIQEAFADVHLRNVSDRYDFDSRYALVFNRSTPIFADFCSRTCQSVSDYSASATTTSCNTTSLIFVVSKKTLIAG